MADEESTARHRLSVGTLARFAEGLTWNQILDITAGHRKAWWRCVIAEAEERGVIAWDRRARHWRLTDLGRSLVRGVS